MFSLSLLWLFHTIPLSFFLIFSYSYYSIWFCLFLLLFITFIEQGSNYDTVPFHIMRRRVDFSSFWETCSVDLLLENTLDDERIRDDYQFWRELGFRHGLFYNARAHHLTSFANETNFISSDTPISAPYYYENIFMYNLEMDPDDLMPSLDSLCAKDAGSVSFELNSDIFFKQWTNAHIMNLWNDRRYRHRVIRTKKEKIISLSSEDKSSKRYFTLSEFPYHDQTFPDMHQAFAYNSPVNYVTSDSPHYPINPSSYNLYRDKDTLFESFTTRSTLYPLIRHNNSLFQNIFFLSFNRVSDSRFSILLLMRNLRERAFLTFSSIDDETEIDPIFLMLSRMAKLTLPRNPISSYQSRQKTFMFKGFSKKEGKNRYRNVIVSSRANLFRDIFLQSLETLELEEGYPHQGLGDNLPYFMKKIGI